MADKNSNNAYFTEKTYAGGFGGIRRLPNGAGNTLTDIRNLRLRSDGSLTVREGFACAALLGDPPRAVWSGSVGGQPETYLLVGPTLVQLDPESGTAVPVGSVSTSAGEAAIFWHGGHLFVLDGRKLWRLSGTTLSEVRGCTPLYGDGWDPAGRGPVRQPVNLLSPSVRIRYLVTDPPALFSFGLRVSRIDRMLINGELAAMEEYHLSFTLRSDGVTATDIPADSTVEFYLTLAESERTAAEALLGCTRALSFGDPLDGRLCLWGGSRPSDLWFSLPVDDGQLAAAREVYPTEQPICFPAPSRLTVGGGRYPVTALCRRYDGALIFTSGDAWTLDWKGREADAEFPLPSVSLLHSSVGCSLPDAAALCGNDPVTVFEGAVWRWHSPSGIRNECSAEILSDGLCDYCAEAADLCRAVLALPSRGEVWFSAPEGAAARVWIYNYTLRAWYSFTGLGADRLFLRGGEVGFTRGEAVFLFDRTLSADVEEDQELEIPVAVESGFLDFGSPERLKNGMEVYANVLTGDISELTLTDDRYVEPDEADGESEASAGCTRYFDFVCAGGAGYGEDRIMTGRFRYMRFRLTCDCTGPFVLRGLTLRAW